MLHFHRPLIAAALLLVSTATLFAQNPPYDNPPEVAPPYYRVRYEASDKPGELIYPVAYTVWVSPHIKTLRGVIVHQHGCGEGSCKSGQTGAFDLHWQALAAKYDCALLAASYEQPEGTDCQMWCDPRNGSDAAFRKSLVDLGAQAGHPELATVPWALWGHSGGGHWCGGMVMLHPERIAAAWLRSGVPLFEAIEGRNIKPHELPQEALAVPLMCNLGTKEGVTVINGRFSGAWKSNKTFFAAMRGQGALLGVSIDPLTSHECGNQRYLAMPWFDACLAARLPEKGGQPLRPYPVSQSYLAPLPTDEGKATAAVPANQYHGDKATSIWLPSKQVAADWLQYMTDTKVADNTPPPTPTNVKLNGDRLTWDAMADLESGVAYFVIERDGEEVAQVPEKPTNRFGRPLYQGLQYSDTPQVPLAKMQATVKPVAGDANPYQVRTVNTAGLKSE
ncbi:hypothetical protein [Blastopirellula retiformator]|uniref:Alpha/beta hydrolase family protein n=1 Tax=Blastopirellula retiformator TaxID=2527970 RepID=A0A5C5V906_9BACT|nr:hypothetical protein [Blastopirellula retiformator]TWT34329.1 hypothetical protein Enr8_17230 [Blastopirellula retiformator]